MSRGYRVRWSEPVWRQTSAKVESADAIAMEVGLLEILPEAEMLALLRARLSEEGWTPGEGGALRRSFGEVRVELTPDGRTLTARSSASREVSARGTTDAEAQARLARSSEAATRELSRKVADRILAVEGEIRGSFQAALQRVYVEALQRKAAALGEVESVSESRDEDGALELTIKVRV